MTEEAQKSEGVELFYPTVGELHLPIEAMARVIKNEASSVSIRPAGDGKVSSVLVIPGQKVHAGDGLISYVDHSLHVVKLQLEQANAQLAQARADLANTSQAYHRGLALRGTTVSAGEVTRRQAAFQSAQAAVRYHEASIQTLKHRVEEEFSSSTEKVLEEEKSLLISPVDGVVDFVNTAVNNDISTSDVVVRISNLSTLWVEAYLPPEEASKVANGSQMILSGLGDGVSLNGIKATIHSIDEEVDTDSGLVKVIAFLPDHKTNINLHPGIPLNARLESTDKARGFIISSQALQNIDGHSFVYKQTSPDHFTPIPVKVLLEGSGQSVVEGNLTHTDHVVGKGSFSLKAVAMLGETGGD
ncbi:efflux RND transporter periplasmic adaptor subunit [Swingsia samuiensis]|uniref:Efflux RND transporter periplasmic adaptor subunit n=2 Tax=Swingsia samuiensis TaxID=1293412 RepID=A0A4Y6UK16_9PROT|nr:efflux RND transporter periplasmic adaptor subunit [Swingsia samuiensis]